MKKHKREENYDQDEKMKKRRKKNRKMTRKISRGRGEMRKAGEGRQ